MQMDLKMLPTKSRPFYSGLNVLSHQNASLALSVGIHRSSMVLPHKGPVLRNADVSFDASLKKKKNNRKAGRWGEMPWHSFDVLKPL